MRPTSRFARFEDFFSFRNAYKRGWFHLDMDTDRFTSSQMDAMFLGHFIPRVPIKCVPFSGTRPADIMGTTDAIPQIVSARFVDTLRLHGFSGWSTYPVRVYDKLGKERKGYFGLAVTGHAESDDSKRKVVWEQPPTAEGRPIRAVEGVYFLPETWDGCDIFTLGGGGHMLCTARVKEALEAAKMTNLEFERMTEVRAPYFEAKA